MFLSDSDIIEKYPSIVSPFYAEKIREEYTPDELFVKVASYGLSSMGYDIRLDNKFKRSIAGQVLDFKNPDDTFYEHIELKGEFASDPFIILQPNTSILGVSVEKFNMPPNVGAIAVGKSTYARLGLIVNITPLEPSWKGFLTIELHNASQSPIKVYAYEGIAQILFFELNAPTPYEGKYQDQPNEPVLAGV